MRRTFEGGPELTRRPAVHAGGIRAGTRSGSQVWRWIANSAAAEIIALSFMMMVITAVAQQEVIARIKITSAASGSWSQREARDQQWDDRQFDLGNGELIHTTRGNGDRGGQDVGYTDLRKMALKPITLIITKTGNCMSRIAFDKIKGTLFISEGLKRNLSVRAAAEKTRLNKLTGGRLGNP